MNRQEKQRVPVKGVFPSTQLFFLVVLKSTHTQKDISEQNNCLEDKREICHIA